MTRRHPKKVERTDLAALGEAWRQAGKRVVWTNGCFDLVHIGHVRSLSAAKEFGDILVVGMNTDASVQRLKGLSRPIVPEGDRAELIASLACVDAVVLFDEDTPTECLRLLKPNVHCKGADYSPPHGKPIPERSLVESYGGRVEFLPMVEGRSTSYLIERICALGTQET